MGIRVEPGLCRVWVGVGVGGVCVGGRGWIDLEMDGSLRTPHTL